MNYINNSEKTHSPLWSYVVAAVLIWTIIIAGSMTWNILNERQKTRKLAAKEARANFDKNLAFRFWAAKHGGVYVPPDERTPPNPYLSHIPDRDVTTTGGKQLTLMNPTYMLRQLMEEYTDLYDIKGHITSLKVLNPINAPDEWEIKALNAFENGVKEVSEFTAIKGEPYLRLMRPMITKKACLKCHAFQGYKEGDVRGGLGVSVPMKTYLSLEHNVIITMIETHGIIWVLGLIAISLVSYRSKKRITERKKAEEALRDSHRKYSAIVENANDAIFMVDPKTQKILEINDTTCKMTGYSKEELKRMYVYELHPEDERALLPEKFKEVSEKGSVQGISGVNQITKDGKLVPVEVNATMIELDGKELNVSIVRDITERKKAEQEREQLIHELRDALAKVKTLSGLIPICSSCQKIRDDKGYWNKVADYISKHSEVEFTHGYCPECAENFKKTYPEYFKKKDK